MKLFLKKVYYSWRKKNKFNEIFSLNWWKNLRKITENKYYNFFCIFLKKQKVQISHEISFNGFDEFKMGDTKVSFVNSEE